MANERKSRTQRMLLTPVKGRRRRQPSHRRSFTEAPKGHPVAIVGLCCVRAIREVPELPGVFKQR